MLLDVYSELALSKIFNFMKFLSILKILGRVLLTMLFIALAGVLTTLIINIVMVKGMEKYIYTDISQLPSRTAVMVLGAQTHGTNLSPILRDRVNGGIEAFQSGKGKKLLLTGDHGELYYDEVNAMRLYVLVVQFGMSICDP
jgi:vancomycin permeability regulator SanA